MSETIDVAGLDSARKTMEEDLREADRVLQPGDFAGTTIVKLALSGEMVVSSCPDEADKRFAREIQSLTVERVRGLFPTESDETIQERIEAGRKWAERVLQGE